MQAGFLVADRRVMEDLIGFHDSPCLARGASAKRELPSPLSTDELHIGFFAKHPRLPRAVVTGRRSAAESQWGSLRSFSKLALWPILLLALPVPGVQLMEQVHRRHLNAD